MKCQIAMFWTFILFIEKFTFLTLWHFISPNSDPMKPPFAVVLWIYKIQVLEEAFFPHSNRFCGDWEIVFFFSMLTNAREINSIMKIIQLISSNYQTISEEMETDKEILKKTHPKGIYPLPHHNKEGRSNRAKTPEKTFFKLLLTFVI